MTARAQQTDLETAIAGLATMGLADGRWLGVETATGAWRITGADSDDALYRGSGWADLPDEVKAEGATERLFVQVPGFDLAAAEVEVDLLREGEEVTEEGEGGEGSAAFDVKARLRLSDESILELDGARWRIVDATTGEVLQEGEGDLEGKPMALDVAVGQAKPGPVTIDGVAMSVTSEWYRLYVDAATKLAAAIRLAAADGVKIKVQTTMEVK